MSILPVGFLYYDGTKYVIKSDIDIVGPAGPPGPQGPAGVAVGPATGDLGGSYPNPLVVKLQGRSISSSAPSDGQILTWVASNSDWEPQPAPTGFTAGGDLSGSSTNQNVLKIHGGSVPIAGSLTTGNVLQVTGASTLSYGAINLAGGSNFVTGTLPSGNQASQTLSGDVTGTTASNTVVTLTGSSAIVSFPINNILRSTGTSNNGDIITTVANTLTLGNGSVVNLTVGSTSRGVNIFNGSGGMALRSATTETINIGTSSVNNFSFILNNTGASSYMRINPDTGITPASGFIRSTYYASQVLWGGRYSGSGDAAIITQADVALIFGDPNTWTPTSLRGASVQHYAGFGSHSWLGTSAVINMTLVEDVLSVGSSTHIQVRLQPLVGSPTVYGAAYILPSATSASGTNYTLLGDGTHAYLNSASSSGTIFLLGGNASNKMHLTNATIDAFLPLRMDAAGTFPTTGLIRFKDYGGSTSIISGQGATNANILNINSFNAQLFDANWVTTIVGAPLVLSASSQISYRSALHIFNDASATEVLRITAATFTVQFATANTSSTINQADKTTNSGTGATLTLQAQNETGTTSIGGALVLASGTGTSTHGVIQIKPGNVSTVNFSPSGGTALSSTGIMRVAKDFTVKARNSGNSADFNLISTDGSNNVAVGDLSVVGITQILGTSEVDILSNSVIAIETPGNMYIDAIMHHIRGSTHTEFASFAETGDVFIVGKSTNAQVRLMPWTSSPTAYGSLYLLPGATATGAGTYTLIGNGTDTYVNIPNASGHLYLLATNTTTLIDLTTTSADFSVPIRLAATGTFPTFGDIRSKNTRDIIAGEAFAGTSYGILSWDTSNVIIGSRTTLATGSTTGSITLSVNSAVGIFGAVTGMTFWYWTTGDYTMQMYKVDASPTLKQRIQTSDTATFAFAIAAQDAFVGSTGTNRNAGNLLLRGGARDGSGLKGGVKIQMNNTTETMFEAVAVVDGYRITALNRGANLTSTQMPLDSGDLVTYIGNANIVPQVAPVSGGILYSNAGALEWYSPGGTQTTIAPNDPHCPKCGRDWVLSARNNRQGWRGALCLFCLGTSLAKLGIDVSEFSFDQDAQ